MQTNLLKVAFRQGAIYLPTEQQSTTNKAMSKQSMQFIEQLNKLGYTASEELLHALNSCSSTDIATVVDTLKEVLGVGLNWNPLVKGWDVPTGENELDYLITHLCNEIGGITDATKLPCGHYIPEGTFPLERYNGCPFCGTQFVGERLTDYTPQASYLRTLELWDEAKLHTFYMDLLTSQTALDATQVDSLKLLLSAFEIPEVEISMKETQIVVADAWAQRGDVNKAAHYLTTPTDILRYLWFKQTGFLQLITPKTIVNKSVANHGHMNLAEDKSEKARVEAKEKLKLKFKRSECRMVASWLNNLELSVEEMCEMMHPKRGMWVRYIRALRLSEYARKKGFEHLKAWLDAFYNERYTVFQGEVDGARLKSDATTTFALLKQRPGLFARSLFANMLWFGADVTLQNFAEVMHKVPMRLVFTLNMYADNYFDAQGERTVKPLGGNAKRIPANKQLANFTEVELKEMVAKVENLTIEALTTRFKGMSSSSKTMYIAPELYQIPLAIGDRSEMVQDLNATLMGTKFKVLGNNIRLFMQWGKDLPAQHLDMDLSAYVSKDEGKEICYYGNLVIDGAKHSGDIINIPDQTGTAEYIELNLGELRKSGGKYVSFTCNAYSNGSITPNLVVGWMDSANPMRISETTGVAYDPSCVQHQVRIGSGLTKGLLFGVLDLEANEIIWLEMPFGGQLAANMDAKAVERLLAKLNSKTTIGNLLTTKASAQGIEIIEHQAEADEVYDLNWARNTAAVTKMFVE